MKKEVGGRVNLFSLAMKWATPLRCSDHSNDTPCEYAIYILKFK